MKILTETMLRAATLAESTTEYRVEPDVFVTPLAKEYLRDRHISLVIMERQPAVMTRTPLPSHGEHTYVDAQTGAGYGEKPEHMTQLFGNVLVAKDHPRIHFRGKLDSLQALVVLDQVQIAEGGCQKLVDDLGNILGVLREMMRCDVLDEAFKNETIIGLTHAELRERSHNPQKFFGVQYMQLPDYTMGRDYALLNQLRAAVRETEVAATEAFRVGNKYTRKDIIEELNRLSSAIHIMMCMYLAGQYR